jgi:hypothetical protein
MAATHKPHQNIDNPYNKNDDDGDANNLNQGWIHPWYDGEQPEDEPDYDDRDNQLKEDDWHILRCFVTDDFFTA